MSDNTMPEHSNAANARIAELEAEYKLHREASLADFLKQSDEHKSEIERLKSRVAFDCRQLLAERDARIAELEAALSDCRFVITELKTRLAEEGRDAINQKLIEKDYELRTTRSKLLERISMLLAEREWMPVGEGLPKMYTAVYVTVRTPQGKNDIDFAFMTQAGWSYHLSPRNGTVTHWMPLPPPPVTPET